MWQLVGAAVPGGDERSWEEVGSVGSGIDSLPHALPALSQPGFQVSWNLIQSWLCRDGDVIPLAELRAPGSPISAASAFCSRDGGS